MNRFCENIVDVTIIQNNQSVQHILLINLGFNSDLVRYLDGFHLIVVARYLDRFHLIVVTLDRSIIAPEPKVWSTVVNGCRYTLQLKVS